MRRTSWLAVTLLCFFAARARAQEGTSVTAGAALPIGALANQVGTGLLLTLRNEGPLPWWQLDYRVDIGFEHFPGANGGGALEYSSFAFNAVGWPSRRLYDFAGVGLYNNRSTRATSSFGRLGSLLGAQAGVGLVFETRYLPFIELGMSNMFAAGTNAPWFAVSGGVHF